MGTRRQTAIRTRISDIVNSKFVHKEGLEPSYVITDLGLKISRARVVGTVVDSFFSEDGNFSSITIADDTGSIRAKAFQENSNIFDPIDIGDSVLIIGRVREYSEENYIIPEIIKKIADPNYALLHKLEVLKEILNQRKFFDIISKEKVKFSDLEELKNYLIKEYGISDYYLDGIFETLSEIETIKQENYKPVLIEAIRKLDKGKGVEIKKLLDEINLPDNVFEEVVNELLNEGICYESSPGNLKLA